MNLIRARRSGVLLGLLAVVAVVLGACGGGEGEAGDDGRISVVTSTNVWGSVVSAVGGDRVNVTSVIDDPSADPHSYEASASDAADVRTADLLVYNGGGYDDFFVDMADGAPEAPKVVAFDVSDLAGAGEHGDHGEEAGHEHGHEHGGVNEHVWYDLPTVASVADRVAAELAEVAPQEKARFADNAEAFKKELDGLTGTLDDLAATDPGRVVATEPVAAHLLEAAGVTDATPPDFAEAVESETDVPAAAQHDVTQLVSGKQVRAVVFNAQTATPVTDKVIATANEAGVPVVEVTETLPEGVTGYIAWMSSQIDALTGALSR